MSTISTASPPGNQKRRRVAAARRDSRTGLLFATPVVVTLVTLFFAPLVLVVIMSASDWTLFAGRQDWGGDNFGRVFDDPLLMDSVYFTLKYTVITTVILMPVALGLALLVQEASRWNNILRTAILIPSAMGIASASLLFYALYSPQVGPINELLASLGLMDRNASLLGSPDGALWATVILVVWRFAGFYTLLIMVGLQSIPTDVYEAATVDGASRWRTFINVTLPLLRPTIAMTMVMSVAGSLLAFDQFYVLTKGGPNNSTLTVVQLIYRYAFETKRDLGMAAALSVLVLIALVVVSAIQLRAMRTPEDEK